VVGVPSKNQHQRRNRTERHRNGEFEERTSGILFIALLNWKASAASFLNKLRIYTKTDVILAKLIVAVIRGSFGSHEAVDFIQVRSIAP